jgi:hypothetical protein
MYMFKKINISYAIYLLYYINGKLEKLITGILQTIKVLINSECIQ